MRHDSEAASEFSFDDNEVWQIEPLQRELRESGGDSEFSMVDMAILYSADSNGKL